MDPKLSAHGDHAKRARTFGLQCSAAAVGVGGRCQEFPDTAEPILQAILSLYRNRVLPGMADPDLQPASPPHSNTSSNSSNSDSGIGFRDHVHDQAAQGLTDSFGQIERAREGQWLLSGSAEQL